MGLFESQTAPVILKRLLKNVPDKYDKREGSVIYDALAPAAIELAEAYIMANTIMTETFATTASRQYLIMRAAEFNVIPKSATYAEVKAKFSQAVTIGTRFNFGKINFTVTSLINDKDHTYKMQCETAGTVGNNCIGAITPVQTISGLTSAAITDIIVPGEDEEDTETFRARYFEALKSQAFGGNGDDYRERVTAIDGVGGVKVYRCWNGGGTVKVVVLDSDYNPPSNEFIAELQEAIDPTDKAGNGYGIAPIGHTVTVTAATKTAINISATVTLDSSLDLDTAKTRIATELTNYFKGLKQTWCKQTETDTLVIRASMIMVHMLAVSGITDVTGIKVNDSSDRVTLDTAAVPAVGALTLTEGA
nr:MAG TPA: Baseplate J like protein [Bacteriophage sp.]